MKKLLLCALLLAVLPLTACASTPKEQSASSSRLSVAQFVEVVRNMTAAQRDSVLLSQILAGNSPQYLGRLVEIVDTLPDADGRLHEVRIRVTPDMMAIGTDDDNLIMPMLPLTAQRLADAKDASLCARKISDIIHRHANVRVEPHPMTPDRTMTTMPVFCAHDSILRTQYRRGQFVAGNKKDIVITRRIAGEPTRLFIYGWHYPNGKAIQPLSAAHGIGYVDYSHGVRLVSRRVLVDGQEYDIRTLLTHPTLHTLLSDEGTVNPPHYIEQ